LPNLNETTDPIRLALKKIIRFDALVHNVRQKMPVYEYSCDCGWHTTTIRSVKDPETKPECIKCGADMKRIFVANAVVFKGNGFYSTDKRG
jgi:putative FmdB family regulatory protein